MEDITEPEGEFLPSSVESSPEASSLSLKLLVLNYEVELVSYVCGIILISINISFLSFNYTSTYSTVGETGFLFFLEAPARWFLLGCQTIEKSLLPQNIFFTICPHYIFLAVT